MNILALLVCLAAAPAPAQQDDLVGRIAAQMKKLGTDRSAPLDKKSVEELFDRLTAPGAPAELSEDAPVGPGGVREAFAISVDEEKCPPQPGPVVDLVYRRCFGALNAHAERWTPLANGDQALEVWEFTIDSVSARLIGVVRQTVTAHRVDTPRGKALDIRSNEIKEQVLSPKDGKSLDKWREILPKLKRLRPTVEA